MTLMTAMTMNYRGSLNGVAALFLKMIDAVMGWKYRSTSATKSDADVKLEAVYLFLNISPWSHRDRRPARS
jgi:hypothetical protein